MPATSAKWKNRAIYSNVAQRIDQWSNIVEITIQGKSRLPFEIFDQYY